jgi:hypothetical protein
VNGVMMEYVSQSLVDAVVDIVGAQEQVNLDMRQHVAELVDDPATVNRLLDIIPEAFGLVLISHMQEAVEVTLPTTFFAKGDNDDWVEISMDREPIFFAAITKAQKIYHSGPRLIFQNNSSRSALLSAFSNALAAKTSLSGAELAGPAFAELSASLYG